HLGQLLLSEACGYPLLAQDLTEGSWQRGVTSVSSLIKEPLRHGRRTPARRSRRRRGEGPTHWQGARSHLPGDGDQFGAVTHWDPRLLRPPLPFDLLVGQCELPVGQCQDMTKE